LAVLLLIVGIAGTGSYLNTQSSFAVRSGSCGCLQQHRILWRRYICGARCGSHDRHGGVQHFLSSSGNLAGRDQAHRCAPHEQLLLLCRGAEADSCTNDHSNPVVERIIERERVVAGNGVSEAFLNTSMGALENRLRTLVLASAGTQSAGTSALYNVISQTNRIDDLGDVDMRNSRISHSTITDSTFVNATFTGTTSLDRSRDRRSHNHLRRRIRYLQRVLCGERSVHHRIRRWHSRRQ